MLLRSPPRTQTQKATAKLKLDPFVTLEEKSVSDALIASVEEFLLVPDLPKPVSVIPISSLARKSYLKKRKNTQIIIHDELFSTTLTWFASFGLRWERPLLAWVYATNLSSELLVSDGNLGLALYVSRRAFEYIDQFRRDDEERSFTRPINLPQQFGPDTPASKVPELLEEQARGIEARNDIQRKIVLFHELGHYLMHAEPDLKELFAMALVELIPPEYRANPLTFESAYGMRSVKSMTESEKEQLKKAVLDDMVEEISCHSIALMSIIANTDRIPVTLDESLNVFLRFFIYSDLVDVIRYQTRLRARGAIRYRTLYTKMYVRVRVMMQILMQFRNVASLLLGPSKANELSELLKSADVDGLLARMQEALRYSGSIYSWGLQGPSPAESLWNTLPPVGILQGLLHGQSVEKLAMAHDNLFGDDVLRLLDPRVVESFGAVPNVQFVCHALIRIRQWTAVFFGDESLRLQLEHEAASLSKTDLLDGLTRGFRHVRQYA